MFKPTPAILLFCSTALVPSLALAAPAEGDAPKKEEDDGFDMDMGDGDGDEDGFDMDMGDGDEDEGFGDDDTDDEGFGDDDADAVVVAGGDDSAGDGDGDDEDDGWDDMDPDEDGEFTFEDISDDPEALAEALTGDEKQAKGENVGTLSGRIYSSDGSGLLAATIEVVGKKYVTYSDADGNYSLNLPPGSYKIRVRADEYNSENFEVKISKGETSELDSTLKPVGAIQVVEVEAEGIKGDDKVLLSERQDSVAAADVIGEGEIAKSGGGSAKDAAARVVGATVVDGKYVFVRGLGHRYGNTLLDGSRVPSPDPNLRTVPLDIFPTGALSSINVQKTFSPDVPGDFTGGSVQLATKGIPDSFVFKAGFNVGFNTATTFRPYIRNNKPTAAEMFGFGNRSRRLPDSFPKDQKADKNEVDENFDTVWTPDQIEQFGESLDTDGALQERPLAAPNWGTKFTIGQGWDTKRAGRFGMLASAGYKTEQQTLREVRVLQYGVAGSDTDGDGEADEFDLQTQTDYTENDVSTHHVAWSGLGLLRWDFKEGQTLTGSVLYSRDGVNEARSYEGLSAPISNGADVRTTRARYEARGILMGRIGGIHEFSSKKVEGMELDWFGSVAEATMESPGMREMVYTDSDNDGTFNIDIGNGAGDQLFQDLSDVQQNGAFNFAIPFAQWSGLESKFKFGGWVEAKQRRFGVRRFNYKLAGGFGSDSYDPLDPSAINPDSIGGGQTMAQGETEPFFITETTRPQDNYRANQRIYAGYGRLDLPFAWWVRASGGARLEVNQMSVTPFDLFGDEDLDDLQATVDDLDVLPVGSLIFSMHRDEKGEADMNIRLTGTRTVARPEFRELAPFAFKDFAGGVDVLGNPDLKSSKIWNADLRWEWFPKAGEVLAASLFYKDFTDPIEVVRLGGANIQTFQNAAGARVLGFELEGKKGLGFLLDGRKKGAETDEDDPQQLDGEAKGRKNWLENWSVGANFAYQYSRVELATCDPTAEDDCQQFVSTSTERPLQGLSPWVANAFIDYDNQEWGTQARLLYNGVARSLFGVGRNNVPDQYIAAFHSLDFVFSQRLLQIRDWGGGADFYDSHHELTLDLGATNLLGQRMRQQWGNRDPFVAYYTGRTFSAGLSYKF